MREHVKQCVRVYMKVYRADRTVMSAHVKSTPPILYMAEGSYHMQTSDIAQDTTSSKSHSMG